MPTVCMFVICESLGSVNYHLNLLSEPSDAVLLQLPIWWVLPYVTNYHRLISVKIRKSKASSVVLAKTKQHVRNYIFLMLRNCYSRFVFTLSHRWNRIPLISHCHQELQSMNIAARLYTVSTGRVRDGT
jgi:hypothetical protein